MLEGLFGSVFENLIVGAIGGTVMLAYTNVVKKYKERKLEMKYPISGDYISTYEDVVEGEIVNSKEPIHLTQNGKHIKGITQLDDRKWILEGEISDNGYLYGMYYAVSIHDKGVGNFFLEFSNDGSLEGIWSGYDSVNKKVLSGRYIFKKKPKIIIKPVTKENITAILHISDKQLGQDYINTKDFLEDDFIKLQASIGKKIVGFITAKELSKEELFNKLPILKSKKLKQFEIIEKIAYIGSVATDPKFEGLGVATELFKEALKELQKKNTMVIMTGWKSSEGLNINNIANKFGFEKILEVEEYWKEDSIKNQYDCPVCKNPCLCSAIVYVKHFNS